MTIDELLEGKTKEELIKIRDYMSVWVACGKYMTDKEAPNFPDWYELNKEILH